jgi:hypothetical protein
MATVYREKGILLNLKEIMEHCGDLFFTRTSLRSFSIHDAADVLIYWTLHECSVKTSPS